MSFHKNNGYDLYIRQKNTLTQVSQPDFKFMLSKIYTKLIMWFINKGGLLSSVDGFTDLK